LIRRTIHTTLLLLGIAAGFLMPAPSAAVIYDVGPTRAYPAIGDVPWEMLAAGDSVRIHWRPEPYHEKWVICVRGTADLPVTVSGILGPDGQRPVIDGRNAVTRSKLDYWNEPRGIVKIGGANVPSDVMPAYVTIENLEIRSGRSPYAYTGRRGEKHYANNAAAIFIEKGEHITVRNCVLSDCGNGLFCASKTSDLIVEYCIIRDNGMENRIYEHNSYTESRGILFQFNQFGPLRKGCLGNNLKDRSSGTVIRYNRIEDGNRQLDLVDSNHEEQLTDPAYRNTFVYGNILIEGDGEGNSQIVHYGGDSRDLSRNRKGMLYFYNNTVISTRTDQTTLFRLSSNDESADIRNNIFYVTQPGDSLSVSNSAGNIRLIRNWLKAGWIPGRTNLIGRISNEVNIGGTDPGFRDVKSGDFTLSSASPCLNAGSDLSLNADDHLVRLEPPDGHPRHKDQKIDIGAHEFVE
jgi:hypothetical protein